MRTFKEIASTREYRRNSLLYISVAYDNVFEGAIEDSIKQLKEKIKTSEEKYEELSSITDGRDVSTFTEEDEKSIDEACYHENNASLFHQHLRSLNEMRIIYLFKNLEISLKTIVKEAYPDVNTKEFYRWYTLIGFLEEKRIPVKLLNGYNEVLQVKDVNNLLKHSDSIPQNVNNIIEFKSGIDSDSLEKFALRVRLMVEIFREKLSAEIAKELFDFDDARLDDLVKEYYYRMGDIAYSSFKQKINEYRGRK